MECSLVWNQIHDFKIEQSRRASFIYSHKFHTKIAQQSSLTTFFWNSKSQLLQYKLFSLHKSFIDQVLSWFVKSCKSCHRFSAIWLASLNKPSNLIGCRILVKLSHWLGKRWNSKHEMVWLKSYGW